MEREKKDLSFILILLSTLIGIAVLFQWAIVTGLYTPQRNPSAWEKLMEKDILFRFLYVILIGGLAFLFPIGKVKDASRKWLYTSLTLVTATMLVVGFSRLSDWYNLFVFPAQRSGSSPRFHSPYISVSMVLASRAGSSPPYFYIGV